MIESSEMRSRRMSGLFLVEYMKFDNPKLQGRSLRKWRESQIDPAGLRAIPDFSGQFLNVRDGLRVVPGQPTKVERDVLIVGGSTVFCREVSDAETLPGQLQSVVSKSFPAIRVTNFGIPGGTVTERGPYVRSRLAEYKRPLVVCYLGINECYNFFYHYIERRSPLARGLTHVRNRLGMFARDKSRGFLKLLSDLVYLTQVRLTARNWQDSFSLVEDELMALNRAVSSSGGSMFVVLQPCLPVSNPADQLLAAARNAELHKINGSLMGAILGGYKNLRERLSRHRWFIDGSSWLDGSPESTYVDWCHLNSEGNQIVARCLYNCLLGSMP